MEAMTRGSALEWGDTLDSARRKSPGAMKIGPFLLGGKEPIYDLSLIDVSRTGVYLTFPEGAAPARDEVYRVVRPIKRHVDDKLAAGMPRLIVAEVMVTRLMENTRVLVRVLRGSVIKGTGVERIQGGAAQ
jgi:hypothetical protein